MNRRTVPFLLLLLLSTHGVIAKPPSDARLADVITSAVRVSDGYRIRLDGKRRKQGSHRYRVTRRESVQPADGALRRCHY